MPFPAAPAPRIAYDDLGVAEVLVRKAASLGGAWENVHPDGVSAMNGDSGARSLCSFPTTTSLYGGSNPQPQVWDRDTSEQATLAILFQAPMRISGIFCFARASATSEFVYGISNRPIAVYSSQNSTNGADGDWRYEGSYVSLIPTSRTGNGWSDGGTENDDAYVNMSVVRWDGSVDSRRGAYPPRLKYRTNIIPLTIPRATALQFRISQADMTVHRSLGDLMLSLHLYGRAISQDDRRIDFWHSTLSQPLPPEGLGWGDVVRGSTGTRTFRLRNASTDDTAQNVEVTMAPGALYTSVAYGSSFEFSVGGGAWASSIVIPEIDPLGESDVISVRRSTPDSSTLGSLSPRVRVVVGSWS